MRVDRVTHTTTEESPTVSVIIPVYDSRYLREAVASVYTQTDSDYEIIVVNDGGPADRKMERWLRGGLPRLRYLGQKNQGPSSARNTGIRAARGSFLAFLDADDCWESGYLVGQMAALRAAPGLDLVYCDAKLVGDSPSAGRRFTELAPSRGEVTCESLLRQECTVVLSGVVAKRAAVLRAGLFDERFWHAEDFDLWLRMLKAGARFGFHNRVLLRRRLHSGSLSSDPITHGEKVLPVLEKFRNRRDVTPSELSAVDWLTQSLRAGLRLEQGKRALATGDFGPATEALRDANVFYRSKKLRLVTWALRVCPGAVAWAHHMRQRRFRESGD